MQMITICIDGVGTDLAWWHGPCTMQAACHYANGVPSGGHYCIETHTYKPLYVPTAYRRIMGLRQWRRVQAKGNTMAKPNTSNAPATPATPATPAPTTLYGYPANAVLQVTLPQGYKLPKAGSARAQWLARLQAHNGKTLAAFVASVQASHPSHPAKGKLAGQLEPVGGWLSAFTGAKLGRILTIKAPQ